MSSLRWLVRYTRPFRKTLSFFIIFISVWFFLNVAAVKGPSSRTQSRRYNRHSASDGRNIYRQQDIFGYANIGLPINVTCDSLYQTAVIGVQDGRELTDDLVEIALSQNGHPFVQYPDNIRPKDRSAASAAIVAKSWSRLSGSSAWLEDYGVYMVVSRVMFSGGGPLSAPLISFLRAQLYDKNWNHLDKYTIRWKDESILFPLVYDVGAQWKKGGQVFGPEDPRIIIEEGVRDAEPVVVFNMITADTQWKRAMWQFRPFSKQSRLLTIRGQKRAEVEKNWAPFFLSSHAPTTKLFKGRPPASQHINFVYTFSPLQILYCNLKTGNCDMVFSQSEHLMDGMKTAHSGEPGSLKGGTNIVPIPVRSRKAGMPRNAWVAFPRTHIDYGCNGWPVYRPMLVVMVNVGTHFYITFASGSVDFDHAILGKSREADMCNEGRILIANSIARWDTTGDEDIMTITFSVDDHTVQYARVAGILSFVESLPLQEELVTGADFSLGSEQFMRDVEISAVANDVLHCAIESATNYTMEVGDMHDASDEIQRLLTALEREEKAALQKEAQEEEAKAWASKVKAAARLEATFRKEEKEFAVQGELKRNKPSKQDTQGEAYKAEVRKKNMQIANANDEDTMEDDLREP